MLGLAQYDYAGNWFIFCYLISIEYSILSLLLVSLCPTLVDISVCLYNSPNNGPKMRNKFQANTSIAVFYAKYLVYVHFSLIKVRFTIYFVICLDKRQIFKSYEGRVKCYVLPHIYVLKFVPIFFSICLKLIYISTCSVLIAVN